MKIQTLFLKLALLFTALVVLFFNVFLFPRFPLKTIENVFFIIALYISALLLYTVVYQAFKILLLVDKSMVFSDKSLRAVRNIKLATLGMGIALIATLPKIYAVAEEEDAPGMILIGAVIILFPFIVSTFVAVLQKLLQNAIDIKAENDLTV